MYQEFGIDYHVTEEDSNGMQKPTVKADHEHCWHVQQKVAYCDQKAEKIRNTITLTYTV